MATVLANMASTVVGQPADELNALALAPGMMRGAAALRDVTTPCGGTSPARGAFRG